MPILQDEVLVGKEHPVVLSASAPKEVSNKHECFNSYSVCHIIRLWTWRVLARDRWVWSLSDRGSDRISCTYTRSI